MESCWLPKRLSCTDAHDFMSQVYELGRRGWIFRGHARSESWHLESTLRRYLERHSGRVEKTSWYPREGETIRRFQNIAHHYLPHLPPYDDRLSWLVWIQHYGGPTRLLDFTFNPAIALYFALRDAEPAGGPFCVHALHMDSIRKHSRQIRKEHHGAKVGLNPAVQEYCIGERQAENEFVGVFDGQLASERLVAQEGLFLVPSHIKFDFENWLTDVQPRRRVEPHNTHWLKFTFENNGEDDYYTIAKQLMQMGISAARLFPGLEGLCESLKFSWDEVVKDLTPGT